MGACHTPGRRSLNTPSMTEISVLVVLSPQNAAQSFTTIPAPSTAKMKEGGGCIGSTLHFQLQFSLIYTSHNHGTRKFQAVVYHTISLQQLFANRPKEGENPSHLEWGEKRQATQNFVQPSWSQIVGLTPPPFGGQEYDIATKQLVSKLRCVSLQHFPGRFLQTPPPTKKSLTCGLPRRLLTVRKEC